MNTDLTLNTEWTLHTEWILNTERMLGSERTLNTGDVPQVRSRTIVLKVNDYFNRVDRGLSVRRFR